MSKLTEAKRAGRVAHVVEYLSKRPEALSSTPRTAKIINKQINK
jgi:hypothetical protein